MRKSQVIVEEWSGTSSNKLSLTAVISPSSSPLSFTLKKHGNRDEEVSSYCSCSFGSFTTLLEYRRTIDHSAALEDDEIEMRKSQVIVEEWSGTSSNKLSLTAVISPSSSPLSFTLKKHGNRFNLFTRRFLEAFVPEGFPSSVTPDYIRFQTWDLLLFSAIRVGVKSATVIGATFQWFLRDLTGMLGGVMFTFYQGSNLDSNAKMWRLVADLMNDLGMLMDLLSPLFPSAFIFIVCLGSLSRSFSKS